MTAVASLAASTAEAETSGESATGQKSKISFLDLPAELRNHIYKDALVTSKAVDLLKDKPYIKEPALLQINRQIRSEGLPVFYGANRFASLDLESTLCFMLSFPRQKLMLLRFLLIISREDLELRLNPKYRKDTIRNIKSKARGDKLAYLLLLHQHLMKWMLEIVEPRVRIAEGVKLSRTAIFLPLLLSDGNRSTRCRLVDFNEFKKYTVEIKDGRLVHVKMDRA